MEGATLRVSNVNPRRPPQSRDCVRARQPFIIAKPGSLSLPSVPKSPDAAFQTYLNYSDHLQADLSQDGDGQLFHFIYIASLHPYHRQTQSAKTSLLFTMDRLRKTPQSRQVSLSSKCGYRTDTRTTARLVNIHN